MRMLTAKDLAFFALLVIGAVGYANRDSIKLFFEKETSQKADQVALVEQVASLEKDVKSLKKEVTDVSKAASDASAKADKALAAGEICNKLTEKLLVSKDSKKIVRSSASTARTTSSKREEVLIERKSAFLEQKEETFIEDPKKLVFKEVIPEGGCIYKSDGKAVLKNGTLVAAGVEIARIHNKELIKEYPYAISTDANHAKACHAWSEKMAKTLQKGDSYVNNDTHRTN